MDKETYQVGVMIILVACLVVLLYFHGKLMIKANNFEIERDNVIEALTISLAYEEKRIVETAKHISNLERELKKKEDTINFLCERNTFLDTKDIKKAYIYDSESVKNQKRKEALLKLVEVMQTLRS